MSTPTIGRTMAGYTDSSETCSAALVVCLRNDWADLFGANLKPRVPERSETDQAKSATHH
jgi:hypothetical protein